MAVSFPPVTLNLLAQRTAVDLKPEKILIVGQKTASGSAASGDVVLNIQNDGSENALFGENSMVAGMVRAFKTINLDTQLDVIPLDDNGGGVSATSTITFAGTAITSDTITVSIGSETNHTFILSIVATDTETGVAGKLVSAVNLDTKIPVTAGNVAGVVTLTADNAGKEANSFGIKSTAGTIGEVTVTGVTAFTGGATDPVLTNILDNAVGNTRYRTIVAPFAYGADFLTDFLDPRFNVNDDILDGVGLISPIDTFANLQAAGINENSRSLVLEGQRIVSQTLNVGPAMLEFGYAISSLIGAFRALKFTDGGNLSQFVLTTAGRDQFGGKELATLPYANTRIPGLPLIAQDQEWTKQEESQLRTAGISLIGNNNTRTDIILDQQVTTRKTDSAGNQEKTFKFLNGVDAGSVVREFYVLNNKAKFGQTRLTSGDVVPNRSIVNVDTIRMAQITFYDLLKGVLLSSGEADRKFFINSIVITPDFETGLVQVDMIPIFVSQLRELRGSITVSFSTAGAI